MKKYVLTILFLILTAAVFAQNNVYLIPRMIYVGDPAVLVLSLPPAAQDAPDIVLIPADANFPFDADIDFHKITLERRTRGSRLTIEFTAFVPGLIELPAVEIGGARYAGLSVTVNSIIDSRSVRLLSAPASALAMPGTAILLYGSMGAIIFLILLSVWFVLKGRSFLKKLKEKWKLKRLFVSMKKTEKRLQRAIVKGIDKRVILDKLSEEFRDFLSLFTANNCRSMTAREFEKLPPDFLPAQQYSSAFLGSFFRSCDMLRFSGANIEQREILRLLGDLRRFLDETETAEKEKNNQVEEIAA